MPSSFFPFSIGCFFLFAALCSEGHGAASSAGEGARVGTAREVVFAEFEDNGEGAIQMELRAAQASPGKDAASSSGALSSWDLTTIELRLFSKDDNGRVSLFATITSPDCHYSKTTHTAASPHELFLDSKDFAVNGGAWTWHRSDDKDTVNLQKPVRVTLKPARGRERIDIFSDTLDITRYKAGTNAGRAFLSFSGGVRMRMERPNDGAIMLFCDTLVARLKNTAAPAAAPAAPRKSAPLGGIFPTGARHPRTKKEVVERLDDALESITAAGRVEVLSEGREMTGKRVEYNQARQTLSTVGDARFYDTHSGLTATGEQIIYHVIKDKIEMFSPPTNGVSPLPIALEMPSFMHKEGRARRGDGTARIVGRYLSILRDNNGKTFVEMTGGVRGKDEDLEFTSKRVFVDIPRSPAPSAQKEHNKLRANLIKAEDTVRANYDGRLLACETFIFRPAEQTFDLTGNPSIATQGARLSGNTIFFDDIKNVIHVTSSATRRTEVSLPPFGKGKTRAAPRETLVSADSLLVTEKENNAAELNFSGNVTVKGEDIAGHCDQLNIFATMPRKRTAADRIQVAKPDDIAAHVNEMTAIGNVSFATSEWRAEGGEARVYPKVALRENTPRDDNGLDGNEPKLLVLRPHPSTPNKRTRLTMYAAEIPAARAANTAAPPASAARKHVPYHIDGDSLEIIGGNMRSRFFMRGNIQLSDETKAVNGRCGEIEGEIVREDAPRPNTSSAAIPRFEFTRIIGRRDVHFKAHGREVTGQRFEISPEAKKVRISGTPSMADKELGIHASPGQSGTILYNGRTGEWEMEKGDATTSDHGRVSRPTVRIPVKKGEWKTFIP
ncbi:MAG: hypothetical protein LBS59_01860 [Puniceicoccales bacterium]|nr:hypothetical protein [Puniceicoccales bacterium]